MDLHPFGGAVAPCIALALAACVSAQSWEATRVLKDIDARGGPSELKALTPTPSRVTITYRLGDRTGVADLYQPNQPIGAGLVLVPGFTPAGKDDPRLVDLAFSLSRARFLVLVPDLQGSREMGIRIEDARSIADAAAYLAAGDRLAADRDVGVVAISYAVALAVLATREPQAEEKIRFVVGVGGYYDTAAMVTFMTTGGFREPGETAWRTARPNPAAKWIFLASNTEVLTDPNDRKALSDIAARRLWEPDARVDDLAAGLGVEGRSLFDLLTNTEAERVQHLLDKLPIAVQRRMERLSPSSYDLSYLAGRLILIHGREDTMIPYTESLSLEAAVPGTELFVIDGFSHIDPTKTGILARLQLIDAIQAVLSRRRSQPKAALGVAK